MWIWIGTAALGGLGFGLGLAFFRQLRMQRQLRLLVSDGHLEALRRALAEALEGAVEAQTFGGVRLRVTAEDNSRRLWVTTGRSVPAAAEPWLVAVLSRLLEAAPVATRSDGRRLWLPLPAELGEAPADLDTLRQEAADRLGAVEIQAA